MLDPYRRLLSTPGVMAFSFAGFLARLPISAVTLGIVLLVQGRSGSYGLAGGVSAAYLFVACVSSPVAARLIDRWGQRRLLVPAISGFFASIMALVLCVEAGSPSPVPHLVAALAGLCYPPVGACVRARWSHALLGDGQLHTAFSLEAVVDEMIFMLGPVLVTLLATRVHETAGLVVVATLALTGGLMLAGLRATEPPVSTRVDNWRVHERLDLRWFLPLLLVSGSLGCLFGATEVTTVAFASSRGHSDLSGALLAVWAFGSLLSGVVTGARGLLASPLTRFRLGSLAMAVAMAPLPFVSNLGTLAAVLFLGGLAISPTLVACMSLVEANVPSSRLTEGMTWVMTGMGFGIAPGAALAGHIIDSRGASAAYWVPVLSGALAALAGCLVRAGEPDTMTREQMSVEA